jgi:hypothetical protein
VRAQIAALYEIRALMLHGVSSYDVNKFIDTKLDSLREPMPNGGAERRGQTCTCARFLQGEEMIFPRGNRDFSRE